MLQLQRLFGKYSGWLRRFKAVYVLNNWLQRNRLQYARERYREQGVDRSVYAPIGHHNFSNSTVGQPWLDQPDALNRLEQHARFQASDTAQQKALRRFVEEGFFTLPGFFAADRIASLNAEVDRLLQAQSVDFNYTGRKIMDAHERSSVIDGFFRDPELLEWLSFLLGTPAIPFQTINFVRGSEQRAHSDSIHMTTQPLGYLAAAWIALEDIGPDQGPLIYYPGSHRLPYVTTDDYDSGNSRYMIGAESNRRYEDHIARLVDQKGLVGVPFLAKAGDVFIWHANLLHGGSAITRPGATRRSMVAHYFGEGVICYHEMSQRPALMPPTS